MPDRESCLYLCSAIPPKLPKDNCTYSAGVIWNVEQKGNSISGFKCLRKFASNFHVYYNTVIFSLCNKGLHSCSDREVWMGWEWQVLVKLCQVCGAGTNTALYTEWTLEFVCKEESSTSVTLHTEKSGEELGQHPTPSFCKGAEHMNNQEGLEWEFVVFYHNPMLKKKVVGLAVVRELWINWS